MKRKSYNWSLPKQIEIRLGDTTYGRQRTIYEEDHLLLILHQAPKADQIMRECIVFLRDPEGKWFCNGRDNGQQRLIKLIKLYKEMHSRFEEEYDKADTADKLFDLIERTTPVARSSEGMHAALQSAREAVQKDTFIIGMRDEAYQNSRNYELISADLKSALDFRLAKNTELQARQTQNMTKAQHKLNILAAITFPLMAIATIFGMNLSHGFENKNPILFWLVLIIGIAIGLMTQSWVVKQKDEKSGKK